VLIANLESDDPELFKLAAEVKLQRSLRNLQRIDDTRDIDVTFISCAEYQLFLDEMRESNEFYIAYHQPDHWLNFRFPEGLAMQSVVGVRTDDAEKFCDWLSQKENKKYRCPTLKEAQEYPAIENHEFATWCTDNYKSSLQWSSFNVKRRIESKLEKLFKGSWVTKYSQLDRFMLALANDFSSNSSFAIHPLGAYLADILIGRDPTFNHASSLRNLILSNNGLLQLLKCYPLKQLLENNDFYTAQQQLHMLQPRTIDEQVRKNLLITLVTILATDNLVEQQQTWYRYIAYFAEYIAANYEVYDENHMYFWWQRLLSQRKVRNYAREKEELALLYAWAKIVEARQKGELPAWEGIRIVRERDV